MTLAIFLTILVISLGVIFSSVPSENKRLDPNSWFYGDPVPPAKGGTLLQFHVVPMYDFVDDRRHTPMYNFSSTQVQIPLYSFWHGK